MTKHLAVALFSLLLFHGCEYDSVVTGELTGSVNVFDEDGIGLSDKSEVKVTVSPGGAYAISDHDGHYTIRNIQPGNYRLIFEKQGYGTSQRFNIIFAAGEIPAMVSTVNLIAVPNVDGEIRSVQLEGQAMDISGAITAGKQYSMIYYFSNSPDVSNTSHMSVISDAISMDFCCTIWKGNEGAFGHRFQLPVQVSEVSPLYVAAYVESPGNDSRFTYKDLETEISINTAVTPISSAVKIR